jgi:hypothetical protein
MNDWDSNTMKEIDMNHGHDLPGPHQVGNQPCRPSMHRYETLDSTIMYIAVILSPVFPHFDQNFRSSEYAPNTQRASDAPPFCMIVTVVNITSRSLYAFGIVNTSSRGFGDSATWLCQLVEISFERGCSNLVTYILI